jgi:Mg2+-importing ATPase
VTVPSEPTTGQAFWQLTQKRAFEAVGSSPAGLSSVEAAARRARFGSNTIQRGRRTDSLSLLVRQFESPIILILLAATVLSGLLGDATDAVIILAIIVLSGLLGFWQERGATRSVEALLAVVRVKVDLLRDGATAAVPVEEVVPGDVVLLSAGDVVPGDCLVIESRALLADEAALTGETYPVEKSPGVVPGDSQLSKRTNSLFMGTHLASGSGTALVMRTGRATEFGHISSRLAERAPLTGFERGMAAFGYLLVRAMVVLVVAIFVVNLLLQRPLIDSALFSLALAVGLTPQLLPAIVTISLSQGARQMATQRVIVKRLDAIEDFGAMSILATDKTGTMTSGVVVLQGALGIDGQPSQRVARLAFLNAHFQAGFSNPIDQAIVSAGPQDVAKAACLDELPYDFTRRRLSVLIGEDGARQIITKGALDSVLAVCSHAELSSGAVVDLASVKASVSRRYELLSGQGFRVLGIATRETRASKRLAPGDESDLTFAGFLTFLDPPKAGADAALRDLASAGISVRMITGDNRLVAAHVAGMVGLDPTAALTGSEVQRMDDRALAAAAPGTAIFAEIEPVQKERIIRALRATGEVVGYLGDGINDAPALHAADVGISVDTAVDVAKEAAAIVLLEKDLGVLLEGVRQGRRTFANTMKYVFVTTSANFGNMISLAVAAVVLPFLPLLAGQILLLNFLTDFPATTIATDRVDPEQLERPHSWDIGFVRNFMIFFGAVSSLFDLVTFAVLRLGFSTGATAFRSGWFLESAVTELAVLLVLRTQRRFFRSPPSRLLLVSSLAVTGITVAIPYTPLAVPLGLDGPSLPVLAALALITVLYVVVTEAAKQRFYAANPRVAARPGGSGAGAIPGSAGSAGVRPPDRKRPVPSAPRRSRRLPRGTPR